QMSAWYVMSALGFYQPCPGNDKLTIRFPLFKKVNLTINDTNKISFIKNIDVNIKDTIFCFKNGRKKVGSITCTFESDFNSLFSVQENEFVIANIPPSNSLIRAVCGGTGNSKRILNLKAPLIISNHNKPFIDSTLITLKTFNDEIEDDPDNPFNLFYSLNDNVFVRYVKPFYITNNSNIKALVNFDDKIKSNLSTAHFYKRPHNYSIQLNCKYNKQYTADGDDGIIDGQYGDKDWRKGGWQGYQAQDFEAVIDMKEVKQFAEISANFLQDTRSWILFPTKVEFYTSDDNINFKLAETIDNTISPQDYNVQTKKLKVKTQKEFSTARYIKIKAFNYGKLPEWHAGKGDDAFIFIDEIEIK
ncbi:MAG: glycoside hydrolase domain-containing protein, partial [Chitinophagaceae bacterium]